MLESLYLQKENTWDKGTPHTPFVALHTLPGAEVDEFQINSHLFDKGHPKCSVVPG